MDDYSIIKNLREFLLKSLPSASKLSGIYTAVPPETPYPYITLEWESSQKKGSRACVSLILKIWSIYQGPKEIRELSTLLGNLLEHPHAAIPLEENQVSIQLKKGEESLKTDSKGIHLLSLSYQAFIKEKR